MVGVNSIKTEHNHVYKQHKCKKFETTRCFISSYNEWIIRVWLIIRIYQEYAQPKSRIMEGRIEYVPFSTFIKQ